MYLRINIDKLHRTGTQNHETSMQPVIVKFNSQFQIKNIFPAAIDQQSNREPINGKTRNRSTNRNNKLPPKINVRTELSCEFCVCRRTQKLGNSYLATQKNRPVISFSSLLEFTQIVDKVTSVLYPYENEFLATT